MLLRGFRRLRKVFVLWLLPLARSLVLCSPLSPALASLARLSGPRSYARAALLALSSSATSCRADALFLKKVTAGS